jgi:hypothetical protein
VPDLKDKTGLMHVFSQRLYFLYRYPEGLFTQHVLTRRNRLASGRDMESVGSCDDDGVETFIVQHFVVAEIDLLCVVEGAKASSQRLIRISDRAENYISRFLRGLQMSKL